MLINVLMVFMLTTIFFYTLFNRVRVRGSGLQLTYATYANAK